MAETEFGISLPDVGDPNWGSFLNGTTFEQIDEFLGMYSNVDISGSGTIALTKEQCRSGVIVLTGNLTGPRLVTLPRKGFWFIANVTDGAADVRVSNAANGGDTGSLVIQGAWAATRNFGTVGATVVTHNLIRVNGAAANSFLVADGDSWNTVDAATARASLGVPSGTYTPIAIAGGTAVWTAAGPFNYVRVGNIVQVAGRFNLTPDGSVGSEQTATFDLPVNSTLNPDTLWGVAVNYDFDPGTNEAGAIRSNAGQDNVALCQVKSIAGTNNVSVYFMYQVT